MLKNKLLFVLIVSALIFTSCSNNEIGESKDVSQDKIYQSYTISYTEGNENAEIFCQFRFAGKNGTTLVLNNPSEVQLDNEKLRVDSNTGNGAFYRIYKPITNFYGIHKISFLNTEGKKMNNDFPFSSFRLNNIPASISKKQNLNIAFETLVLQGDDYIEVGASNTDSSFNIIHTSTDKDNFITIPIKELQRQKGKDVTLEIMLYRKVPLLQNTVEGGEIQIRYFLKPVKIKLTE